MPLTVTARMIVALTPHVSLWQANGCRPSFFDSDIDEATRLLSITLKFLSVETDSSIIATLPDPSRPPIKFVGQMRGVGAGETGSRATRGTVSVMKDGNIRWTFVRVAEHTWNDC